MSAGYYSWISPELDNAPDRLLRFVEVFEATGIYLFTAAGNYYSNVNSSYVQDENNSGWLNIGNEQYPYLQKFSVFKDRKFEVYVASNTWGIPDAEDLFFSRAPAFEDEISVYGTTYRYTGADTEFFFNVNKNYADGMQYNFRLDLIDTVTQEVIIAKNTTHPFSLEKSLRADQRDFLEETVYFNIPGEFVPGKFLGEEVLVKVYV